MSRWAPWCLAALFGATATAAAQNYSPDAREYFRTGYPPAVPAPLLPAVLPGGQSFTATQTQTPEAQPQPGEAAPSTDATPEAGAGGDSGQEPASRPGERASEEGEGTAPALGPTLPEDVKLLMNTGVGKFLAQGGLRVYGWVDPGYTYASVGPGLLSVEPRENRFGDEFLLSQMALVVEKPLKQEGLNFGFNMTYYAGADPALLQPKGGIDDPAGNPRFSHDFRQLYASAHLPIFTEGGVDVKLGRQGTIIGYESALAPYRPFYSNAYQFFYSEDGAWTGGLANWHVNKQLDVLSGFTLGANTFFTKRSHDSICYIGQVNYWLEQDKKTLLTASLHTGPNAIFAAPGLAGDYDTIVELRVLRHWSKYFSQVVQNNMGWDNNVPGVGTASWYGLYTILIGHLDKKLDVNTRLEWFDDVQGTRTGVKAVYEEATFGFDYHPVKWLRLRPELRGDFANNRAFGNGGVPKNHNQLTAAIDALFSF